MEKIGSSAVLVERTYDWDRIRRIVTHPNVYPLVSDDNSPAATEWEPIFSDTIYYMLNTMNGVDLGVFTFIPENSVCWKVHTCFLPVSYGEKSRIAAKRTLEWIWKNTKCVRVVTEVPVFNRLAYQFAKAAGLIQYGLNPKSYLKNGSLHDVLLLGVSRCQ